MSKLDPQNPELLTFLLGSFLDQKNLIFSRSWSSAELTYIWQNVTKLSFATDTSNTLGYHLHQALLKQPLLPEAVVMELWALYENNGKINLKSEILSHPNFNFILSQTLSNEYLTGENFIHLSWILNNPNSKVSGPIGNLIANNSALIERWKYLKILKRGSSSDLQGIDQCLKRIVSLTDNKGFLNSFFYWIQREKISLSEWSFEFLRNPHTNGKVLKTIFANRKALREDQLIDLLIHPQVPEDLLSDLINYYKSTHYGSANLLSAFLKLLDTKFLAESELQRVFQMFCSHESMLSKIILQPKFNPQWLWATYLNSKFFYSLNPDCQSIIKNTLKI